MKEIQGKFAIIEDPRHQGYVKHKFSDVLTMNWLEGREKWPGLTSVFSIERIVDVRGRMSKETSYYISSLDASPQRLMAIAREHWKIEFMHGFLM